MMKFRQLSTVTATNAFICFRILLFFTFTLFSHHPYALFLYSALCSTRHLPFFSIVFSLMHWLRRCEPPSGTCLWTVQRSGSSSSSSRVCVCVCMICPAVSSETTAKQAQFVKSREVWALRTAAMEVNRGVWIFKRKEINSFKGGIQ